MKKLILTEEQVKYIINEELGIAMEVSNLTEIIEEKIYNYLIKGVNSFNFDVRTSLSEFNVVFLFKHFKDGIEFKTWLKTNELKNGYSYEENRIYLTLIQIGNNIPSYDLVDTIQHECSHYWECKMKGGPISTDVYQEINKGISNKNIIISNICKMLYYSNKNEINAYVNGSYKTARKKDKIYKDYKEFITDNGVNEMYTILKNSHNTLSKYDEYNSLFIDCIVYLKSHGIINSNYRTIDNVLNYLYKVTEEGYKYFIKKIGMAYALYCQKQEEEKYKKTDLLSYGN